MTEEKILSRIRKMLNLANDEGAAEGERDNALRMANNLMTKYQIDMAMVDKHLRDSLDPRGHYQQEGWNTLWAKYVRMHIARLFFCKYYTGRKINATRGVHNFVGRESNATTAMLMSEWIIRSLLRETDKRYGHRLNPESRAFCMGAQENLGRRIRELHKAAQEQVDSVGSALVVVDLARSEQLDNDRFIEQELNTKLVVRKSRKVSVDNRAFSAGFDFGSKINLNKQVAGTKAKEFIK